MWKQKIGKLRGASCKKRGFRSGFRRVPGALLESKNACGCSGVAFSTRVPPRVPAGSAGLRPCKCANGLRLPAKNGGFLGQLLEGPARVLQDPGVGPCWIQMGSGQAPSSAAGSVGFCRGFRGCPHGPGHAAVDMGQGSLSKVTGPMANFWKVRKVCRNPWRAPAGFRRFATQASTSTAACFFVAGQMQGARRGA